MVDFTELEEKMKEVKTKLDDLNDDLMTAKEVCEGLSKSKDADIDLESDDEEIALPSLLLSEIEESMNKANETLDAILSSFK